MGFEDWRSALYDLEKDPGQTMPLVKPDIEAHLCEQIISHMVMLDAPPETYRRFGLRAPEET
jgi:hypothetical protein